MAFKCPNCGGKHDFVHEARACIGKKNDDQAAVAVLDRIGGTTTSHVDKPSAEQMDYVLRLLTSRIWPDKFSHEDLEAMPARQVSRLIDRLKASPRKEGAPQDEPQKFPDVPAGRYALLKTHPNSEESSEESDYDFWQVDRPTEGKWKGYTFLNQLFGAPGDYHQEPIRDKARKIKVLKKIAADPEQASLTYGRVSEVCGVCHSPLTNKESRDRGIGPICASKTGWGAA